MTEKNPVIQAREERLLTRGMLAMLLEISTSELGRIERGEYVGLSKRLEPYFKAAGFDFSQLEGDYYHWRIDQANELRDYLQDRQKKRNSKVNDGALGELRSFKK